MKPWHGNFPTVIAAILGGIIGYLGFVWLLRQGFYGLALPGALIGFLASSTRPTWPQLAWLTGGGALILSVWAEWRHLPFRTDDSFSYFISHLHQLTPVTFIMIALGTGLAFWMPWAEARRSRRVAASLRSPGP